MGANASLGLLADAASSLQSFVTVFVSIYILFILAYVLLSWIQLPYSNVVSTLRRFLTKSSAHTCASSEAGYRHSGHSISRRSWPSSSCSLRHEPSTP